MENDDREKNRDREARKSIGRRVSFASVAHVRLYEKEDQKKEEAPYSPIAGLDLLSNASSSDGAAGKDASIFGRDSNMQMPDLSSVRKNSDAFNLRLSLGENSRILDDSGEDMSLDEDSSILQNESIETSFDVHVRDSSHIYNDMRDSVFGFFGESVTDQIEEEEVENMSPIPSTLKKAFDPENSVRSPKRSSVGLFFGNEESPSQLLESQQKSDVPIFAAATIKSALRKSVSGAFGNASSETPPNQKKNYRYRDSVAPFFITETDDNESDNVTPKTKQYYRARDSVAGFFEDPADANEEDFEIEDVPDKAIEAKSAKYRNRDSVAAFFTQGQDQEVTPKSGEDYRHRDSVATFFKEPEDNEEVNQEGTKKNCRHSDSVAVFFRRTNKVEEEINLANPRESKANFRQRDSVAAFFKRTTENDEKGDSLQEPETGQIKISKTNFRHRDSVATFFKKPEEEDAEEQETQINGDENPESVLISNGTPAKQNLRSRDSVAAFFDSNQDISDISMDLGTDSSFISGQQLQNTASTNLVQDSVIDDSFSSELDMEVTNCFLVKPQQSILPAAELTEQKTPPRNRRKSIIVTPNTDRVLRSAASPKITPEFESRQETPTKNSANQQTSTKNSGRQRSAKSSPINAESSPLSRRDSIAGSSSSSALKKTPVKAVAKRSYTPVVSSPLAARAAIVAEFVERQTPKAQRNTVTTRASSYENIESSVAKTTPKSTLKTGAVQTPLLMKFVKSIGKSETKTKKFETADVQKAEADDEDEDIDMLAADDTFNKPSDLFTKALKGKRRISDFNVTKKDDTVMLKTFGDDLINKPLAIVDTRLPIAETSIVQHQPTKSDGSDQKTSETQEDEEEEEKITLSEFLQATGLHFIDGLSTTLRRETSAFTANDGIIASKLDFMKASILFAPELGFFERVCKSLIDFVEESHDTMRKFEMEISKQTPEIFYAYIESQDDEQDQLMAQLKSLKSLARLYAKKGWYQWRRESLVQFQSTLLLNFEILKKDLKKIQEFKAMDDLLEISSEQIAHLEDKKNRVAEKYQEFIDYDVEEYKRIEADNEKIL